VQKPENCVNINHRNVQRLLLKALNSSVMLCVLARPPVAKYEPESFCLDSRFLQMALALIPIRWVVHVGGTNDGMSHASRIISLTDNFPVASVTTDKNREIFLRRTRRCRSDGLIGRYATRISSALGQAVTRYKRCTIQCTVISNSHVMFNIH